MAQHTITEDAVRRLQSELDELEGDGRRTIQARIQTAREEGDLRENAEYHEAKEDQAFLEGRIVELKAVLDDHEILESASTEAVEVGVVVTLRDQDGDEAMFAYTSTLESVEDLPIISPESPLGRALSGHREGETVSYEAPGGTFKVEIVSIGAR